MLAFLARMEARVRDVERPSFPPHTIRDKAPSQPWEPELEERLPREEQLRPPATPDPSAELAAFSFGTTYLTDNERPLSPDHAYQPPLLIPDRPSGFDRRHSLPSTAHQNVQPQAGPPRRCRCG